MDRRNRPFIQDDLWDSPIGDTFPAHPCPGCGAKAGTWALSWRWRHVLGGIRLCVECADDREVVEMHIRDDPPPDPDFCPHAKGSDEKIEWMARRAAAGLSIFQVWDNTTDPAPFKRPMGAPDHHAADGETGVEKCGKGWRVRPFWRGRKWPLGVFAQEGEARDRVKEFWRLHRPGDHSPPVLWLPTSDEDGAVAIENEHLQQWKLEMPGLRTGQMRRIARQYRVQLKRSPKRLPTTVVYDELVRRLRKAAGSSIFSDPDAVLAAA